MAEIAIAAQGNLRGMKRNADEARAAYQEFLTSWKDGDAGTSILRQAKPEYARRQ
jgi:hypothetical protein